MAHFYYRSVGDMSRLIIKNLSMFPHNVDLIVGIPRSGMLPANLLALYLNKPYTDIDSFVQGRIYGTGGRGQYINQENFKKILVIDDSVAEGKALAKAKQKLEAVSKQYEISYGAIYVSPQGEKLVDYYCESISSGLVFEWNIFLFPSIISKSCFDIDGVLCANPPVDDDGPIYLDYISNATPLYLPKGEIDTVITCRLEKYRKVTEAWLKKWNIQYKNLIMLDIPTKEEREKWGLYGVYKGEYYKKSNAILFFESSLSEAMVIKKISRKPVFCTETFSMINTTKDCRIAKIKSVIRCTFPKIHKLYLKARLKRKK